MRNIAETNGLEYIETTSQSNGYPSNLKKAIIGFETFKQAEEIAKKYNLEITSFIKKDGWNFWYRTESSTYKAFTNSSNDYGDDYSEVSKITEDEFIDNQIFLSKLGNVVTYNSRLENFQFLVDNEVDEKQSIERCRQIHRDLLNNKFGIG